MKFKRLDPTNMIDTRWVRTAELMLAVFVNLSHQKTEGYMELYARLKLSKSLWEIVMIKYDKLFAVAQKRALVVLSRGILLPKNVTREGIIQLIGLIAPKHRKTGLAKPALLLLVRLIQTEELFAVSKTVLTKVDYSVLAAQVVKLILHAEVNEPELESNVDKQ